MPVTLTILGGRPKRDIIEMMREVCGQAGFEFELTPEEIASDLRLLDVMMAGWPWNTLGYNASAYGAGLPEEESGLVEQDIEPVVYALAVKRMPGLGATMSPEARASMTRGYQDVCSRAAAAAMPTAYLSPNSPRGMGRRRLEPWITESPPEAE